MELKLAELSVRRSICEKGLLLRRRQLRQQVGGESCYVGRTYRNNTDHSVKGGTPTDQYMTGQMYVERLTPPVVKHKHPLIFIHGLAQTAAVRPPQIISSVLHLPSTI